MKKNERLIQELLFINGKKQFNLRDFTEQFHISKRTAIRDIAALEEIGAPLYSMQGVSGGYKLLENSLLPPIYFKDSELYAIFFSLQLLKSLIATPFDSDYQKIRQKLFGVLNSSQVEKVSRADELILYAETEQRTDSPQLKHLFAALFNHLVIEIVYTRYRMQTRIVQPLQLQIMDGNWYLSCYDCDKEAFRIFRTDFIQEVKPVNRIATAFTSEEIKTLYQKQIFSSRPDHFKVKLHPSGVQQFYKRHYDSMSLIQDDSTNYLVGQFNKKEIPFLVNYLLTFGKAIIKIEPVELKTAYHTYLLELLNQSK